MLSTVGGEGQGGKFGPKEVRTHRLPLVAIFRGPSLRGRENVCSCICFLGPPVLGTLL